MARSATELVSTFWLLSNLDSTPVGQFLLQLDGFPVSPSPRGVHILFCRGDVKYCESAADCCTIFKKLNFA